MKKLIIILTSLIAFSSNAQTLIPKLGTSYANLSGGVGKSKFGFTGGIALNLPLSNYFSIQPELSFIQKGTRIKFDFSLGFGGNSYSESTDLKMTINYLEIPVMGKYIIPSNTKFYIIIGPSVGIGLGGNQKGSLSSVTTENGNVIGSTSESFDEKIKFGSSSDNEDDENVYIPRRIDIGFQFGGGFVLKEKIIIDVRYGAGLTNLTDAGADEGSLKNSAFQLTVGLPLSL